MKLLPTPSEVRWGTGTFALPDPLPICGGGNAADVLAERLGIAAGIRATDEPGPGISFTTDVCLGEEDYRLSIDDDGVQITSATERGAGWAVQTLLQLLPVQAWGPGPMEPADLIVSHVEIADRPRYGWRGSLIDVARHFLPMDGLLRHLEIMAMHKLNVLHLHLTDDQGWRLPVDKYPELTRAGAWRPGTVTGHTPPPDENDCDDWPYHDGRPHGGAYTADELRALVAAADRLGIAVIPEVDMPGHMEAAIAAYPWLGACDHVSHPRTCFGVSEHVLQLSESTLQFCRDVLDATMELFPNAPIHIGGDECPGREWLVDPVSKATMARVGASTPAEAQAWFTREICAHVLAAGRRVIAWDEVLEGGAPDDVIVTAWRSGAAVRQAVEAGHDVIAVPVEHCYLDYAAYVGGNEPLAIGGPIPQATVARWSDEVASVPDGAGTVLGGQLQLWTEYVHTWARAQYHLWPRGAALAQQLWAGHPGKTAELVGLGEHLDRLTAAEVNWCRPPTGDR